MTPTATGAVVIDLPAIEHFADQLDRLADDIPKAQAYLTTHGTIRRHYVSDIFLDALRVRDDLTARVSDILREVRTTTAETAERLRVSRDIYAATEDASRGEVEAVWKLLKSGDARPSTDSTARPGRDCELAAPADALRVEPEPSEPMPDLFDRALNVVQYMRPSGLLMDAIEYVFGGDPIAELARKGLGDWEDVSRVGAMLRALARFCESYAAAMYDGITDLTERWTDDASDACRKYVHLLIQAIEALGADLDQAGRDYQHLAARMWSATSVVAAAITYIIKLYIIPALGVLVLRFLGPVGLPIALAASAVSLSLVVAGIQTWIKVGTRFASALLIVKALIGALGVASARLDRLTLPHMPRLQPVGDASMRAATR